MGCEKLYLNEVKVIFDIDIYIKIEVLISDSSCVQVDGNRWIEHFVKLFILFYKLKVYSFINEEYRTEE
jgi:hypothetical protein